MANYCYIVRCVDGTLYTGWTTDLERRVKEHNSGQGGRYTRSRRPVALIYAEELPDRGAAMKREIAIKRLPRNKKLALADQFLQSEMEPKNNQSEMR